MTTRYLPHLLYATMLTSFSVHLLNTRKSAAEERSTLRARETILTSINSRLRVGENVTDEEIARLKFLGDRKIGLSTMRDEEADELMKRIGWKETVFGKKREDWQYDDQLDRELEQCESDIFNLCPPMH